MIERFGSDDIGADEKCLWDCCNSVLLAKGLPFHARHDSDRRSQLEAKLADLLGAFDILDSSDSLPTICCEATSLLRLPPPFLDPVAEQVESNSQALKSQLLRDLRRNSPTFFCLAHHLTLLLDFSRE